MLPASVLLALSVIIASAASARRRPFQARPDPLQSMMPSKHRMPMQRRRLELLQHYRFVHEAIALGRRLGDGQMEVELRRSTRSAPPLIVMRCREAGKRMFGEEFYVDRDASKRVRMSSVQVEAMQHCQCSGVVRGLAGSIVELTLCGRLT